MFWRFGDSLCNSDSWLLPHLTQGRHWAHGQKVASIGQAFGMQVLNSALFF